MKKHLIVLSTLAIFSIPALAAAAPVHPGPYFSGFLGASVARETGISGVDFFPPATSFSDQVKFDPGVYVGGTGGYDFGFLRLEGEISYRHAGIDSVTDVNNTRYRNVDGDLGAFATMFNVFIDMHTPSRITPYLGGGIGFTTLHLSDTNGINPAGTKIRLYDRSSDTVAAYQVGAGIDMAITSYYSLDLGYRYFITEKANLEGDFITSNFRFESHNAMVGFKMKF